MTTRLQINNKKTLVSSMIKQTSFFAILFVLLFTHPVLSQEKQSNLTFELKGGFAYLTAKPHESLTELEKDHILKLKSGNHLKGTAHYYLNSIFGLGIHWSRFGSKPETPFSSVDYDGDGIVESGKVKNDFKISLYAPSIQILLPISKNRIFLKFEEAIGLLEYHNEYFYINDQFASRQLYFYTGYNPGVYSSTGIVWKISENMGFGFDISSLNGSFKKLKNNNKNIKLEDRENVTRINLEAGITVFL